MGGGRLEGRRQRSGERLTEGLKESAGEKDGRKGLGRGTYGRLEGVCGRRGWEEEGGGRGEGETCSKTVVLPDIVDFFLSNVFPLGGGGLWVLCTFEMNVFFNY